MNGLSSDVQQEKLAALKNLVPEAFADGKIDVDRLRKLVGEDVLTEDERYRLEWSGKGEVYNEIAERSSCTLTLDEKRSSKDWKDSSNVFIEGENLEVLRTLQKSYHGKVRMIYIDPPYNTGRDFVYNDNFNETEEDYCENECNIDENGFLKKAYKLNSRDGGRFHSNWLSMMYSRLYLARNLMKEEGVIFVSIDDNEVHNLRHIMDEIFGSENFIGCAGRVAKKSNNKGEFWAPNFDYVLTYAKNVRSAIPFFGGANTDAYNLVDKEGPRKGEKYQLVRLYMSTIQNRNPEQRFYINCPDGSKIIPPGSTLPPERPVLGDGIWRWSRKKFEAESDRIVVKKVKSSNLIDEEGNPAKWNVFTKTYLNDVIRDASAKPNSLVEGFINQIGSHELNKLGIPFDYPKPSTLIQYLVEISRTDKDSIILDFFAGSGSTAQAVMAMNAKDGGNRKYICVQMPEETEVNSEARKAGYKKISDISIARIKKASEYIKQENKSYRGDLDFRVYKETDSHFPQWHSQAFKSDQDLEQAMIDYSKAEPQGTAFDRATEVLLKLGYPLTTEITEQDGFMFADDVALVLDSKFTLKNLSKVFNVSPKTVVILEKLFKKDEEKINFALRCKEAGVIFQTV